MSKKVKNAIFPTALFLGIVMLGLLSASVASAQDSTYPSIIQKIAEKFNLNEDEVAAVFDEERDEHHAEMQAKWSERLDDLVNDGKINAEQKQAILDKHEEMHNKMEEWKDLDPEERHEKMRGLREEFRAWAEEQGIDLPLLGPYKHGFMVGFHRGYMMGAN
jgi:polyhydroxyalkanoate synthesis regulator phasin